MFTGCITALVTPFRRGRVDIAGLRRNVRFQADNGCRGLLVAGSTGEAASLSEQETEQVIRAVRAEARGRLPVIAGTGTNNTAKTLKAVAWLNRQKVDALLVVSPYYVKPTQEGLYRHFRAVAEATDLPIIVYNIPGRTAVNIEPATIGRIARDCPNVVAVKEAAGSLDQVSDIIGRCSDRLTVLSGDDSLTLPMLAVGARGVISVVSNIVPHAVQQMIELFEQGRIAEAAGRHLALFPLVKAMFVESNPIPVKWAMNALGMAAGEPRLPLLSLSEKSRPIVLERLRAYGLRPRGPA